MLTPSTQTPDDFKRRYGSERPSRVSMSPDGKYLLSSSTISMSNNKTKTLYKIRLIHWQLFYPQRTGDGTGCRVGSRIYILLILIKGVITDIGLASMQESIIVETLPKVDSVGRPTKVI